jgi:hypothetical protein
MRGPIPVREQRETASQSGFGVGVQSLAPERC